VDTNNIEENNSDEPLFEIKSKGDHWKVHYPDEGDIATPFIWYDKEGKVRSVIHAGGSSGKLTEANEEFATAKEAITYARDYLGAKNIKLTRTKKRKPKKD
jgi:hypothetical protein